MFRKTILVLMAGLVCLVIGPYFLAQEEPPPQEVPPPGEEAVPLPPEYQAKVPQEVTEKIPLLGSAMFIAAKEFGIAEVAGKPISVSEGPPGSANAKKLKDVGIGVHPTKHENEPTVVASPKDKKKLVAGSHFFGPPAPFTVRCVAFTSSDRGATWSAPVAMPHLHRLSSCSDPVLAYAPDGSRVYYAYMDIKVLFFPVAQRLDIAFDIVVSHSNDDGLTWSPPVVALKGRPTIIFFRPFRFIPGFDYDKPWIGTHVNETESSFVYVTATRFDNFFPGRCHISFARSGAKAAPGSFSLATQLDASPSGCAGPVVVQGSRPTGGLGGDVLVAWYNSGTDGWLRGSFKIRTRRSFNHGATWDPIVDAAVDSFEAPFFLGPFFFYHRWWATMFPDVEIDPGGEAHIVYTHDPVAGSSTAEDGDIRYITSAGAPFTAWSTPITVNDDGLGRAQGFAALKIQHGGQSSSLHVIWEDHRLSPNLPIRFPNSPNLFYDIFYARKVPGGGVGWSKNLRVSDASSISDFLFVGDYNDLAANDTLLFGIWTDRRHRTSIFQFEDNVFGSRIIAGGGTP